MKLGHNQRYEGIIRQNLMSNFKIEIVFNQLLVYFPFNSILTKMKKITLSLIFLVSATLSVFSQVKEGHIEYKISVVSDDPESAGMADMFGNSTMNIHFKSQLTRTELDMGFLMQMTVINDDKSGDILMLLGGMMGNQAILTTVDEMNEFDGKVEEETSGKVELINETKTILGYVCKKAILSDDDGSKMTYWYTSEINFSKRGNQVFDGQIPGIPLEIVTKTSEMTMTWTAVNFEKKVENTSTLFSMEIPDGYEKMSYEEFIEIGN